VLHSYLLLLLLLFLLLLSWALGLAQVHPPPRNPEYKDRHNQGQVFWKGEWVRGNIFKGSSLEVKKP
jgi:hypothetical protein